MEEATSTERQFMYYLNGYKNLIIKVAGAYCSDFEERKDLVQDIILQLWRAYPGYDGSAALSTWTYRIALNVSISYLRKETARRNREDQYRQNLDVLTWEDSVVDERLELLYRVIEKLRPLDKAVLILSLEGCKNAEIADIMGMSASTVSTRLYRIKEQLKSFVNA